MKPGKRERATTASEGRWLRDLTRKGFAALGGTVSTESGASLTEYALLIGLLAIVVIGSAKQFGGALYAMYLAVAQALTGA